MNTEQATYSALASVNAVTCAAPACLRTEAHSFIVAPVVNTSSTRTTLLSTTFRLSESKSARHILYPFHSRQFHLRPGRP